MRVILAVVFAAMLIVPMPEANATQLPNPAAVFCTEQGGSYAVVDGPDGQRGVCTLPDGREVDAWAYFRQQRGGDAQDAGSTRLPNPAAVFCTEQGGSYAIVDGPDGQHGVCTLPDGREVDAWEYFRAGHDASG